MGSKLGVGVATATLAMALVIGGGIAEIAGSFFGGGGSSASLTCAPDDATSTVPAVTAEQLGNAATVVAVGKQMGVPEPGWVVAIATALQESGLRNLLYGDRDSLGLFQQRPSMGWGTPDQITTPTFAASKFFEHLLATPNWQAMSVNDAAQAVQGSGFPNAYAQHEDKARAIVAAVSGVRCEPVPATTGTGDCNNIQAATSAAMTAINYACGQRGLPYVSGGNGNPGFDCSGLTHAAYAAAGITIPRTAQTQYNAGPLLSPGVPLRPGDLVFFGTPSNIHHVGISLGGTQMINAPTFGQPVQVDDLLGIGDYAGASRPIN
jgi:cell wall-associated NlpC family hydrolase